MTMDSPIFQKAGRTSPNSSTSGHQRTHDVARLLARLKAQDEALAQKEQVRGDGAKWLKESAEWVCNRLTI